MNESPVEIEGVRDYSFFRLVGLLLRMREGAVAPGGGGPVRHETLRFRPNASLGFPSSDIDSVDQYEVPGEEIPIRFRMTVNFMGLYGPASPMPNHFTEEMLWADSDNTTQRDFLDLFHHRMISFVYRAWMKYRHWAHFQRKGSDATSSMYFGLVGLGTPGLKEVAPVPPLDLLRAAGLLGGGPRSAAGLSAVLRDHFDDVPLHVESFLWRMAPVPPGQRSKLGQRGCVLARDAIVGERVSDRSTSFGIHLGPLDAAEFHRWLPGGERFVRLTRLVRFYLRDPLDFSLILRLRKDEMPALRLGEPRPLGQMSWLLPTQEEDGVVRVPTARWDPLRAA